MTPERMEAEASNRWIACYLEYDTERLRQRQVDAIAKAIYPTMWGDGTSHFISPRGTSASTARAWAREALDAAERVAGRQLK
jgi:hypothetical protein